MLTASTAASALDVLGCDHPIDLLFTDVILGGGMNGFEIARED